MPELVTVKYDLPDPGRGVTATTGQQVLLPFTATWSAEQPFGCVTVIDAHGNSQGGYTCEHSDPFCSVNGAGPSPIPPSPGTISSTFRDTFDTPGIYQVTEFVGTGAYCPSYTGSARATVSVVVTGPPVSG